MSDIAFEVTEGAWRVTGSYEEPNNIVFYYKGELFRELTYPSYRIWNIASHFSDLIPELEEELANTTEGQSNEPQ